MTSRAVLWERLVAAGIASGPVPADEDAGSAWYVTAMVAVSAWLAALFLLAFVGIVLEALLRSAGAALGVGVVVCTVAVGALHAARGRLFATQLAVAASLAGQALFAYGVLGAHLDVGAPWLALALFEVALVAAGPEDLHRVLCTAAAVLALRMALFNAGAAALYPAVLAGAFVVAQTRAARAEAPDSAWSPIASGVALAILLVVPFSMASDMLWFSRGDVPLDVMPAWIGTLALATVTLAAIGLLLREAGVAWRSRTGVAATLAGAAVVLAAWPVPGVVVAHIVLLLAFAAGRRALQGLAVLALLDALAHYYHALDRTLLVKAAALGATGIVLIGARFLVRHLGNDHA